MEKEITASNAFGFVQSGPYTMHRNRSQNGWYGTFFQFLFL